MKDTSVHLAILVVLAFIPEKAVTTGEGGMIITNKDDIAEKIRRLRDHGANMSDLQRHLGSKPYILADHSDAGC